MRRTYWIAATVLMSLVLGAHAAEFPQVGDPAPPFKLQATDGKEYALEQFRGKEWVVIAWYPKALTAA
jgi:thioredoxin-dependent peroxiredoxin